jgi:hypothetical protein
VANYNVDIAVAVRNLDALKGFKRELTSVQRAVDDFNNKGLSVEERKLKAIARKKEDASLKALQRVAAADLKSLEGLAKKELELEEKVFKDKLQSIKDLQRAEEKATKQQIKDDDRAFKNRLEARAKFDKKVEASAKSMIDGVRKVNEGAKQLDDLQTQREIKNDQIVFNARLDKFKQETRIMMQDIKRRNKFELDDFNDRLRERIRLRRAAERKASRGASSTGGKKGPDFVNAALTAGAFPLLFGGGPGTAIGGALGGALTGQLFGGLTVVGQVVGGAVDAFVAKTSQLGQALNPLTADLEALIAATGNVNSNTSLLIKELEAADLSAAALTVATEELAILVGRDGVDALKEFGSDTVELGNEFNKAMSIMAAGVATVANAAGILKGVANELERITLRQQINRLIGGNTKSGERLRSTLRTDGPGQFSRFRGSQITEETFDMMRKINREEQNRVNQTARSLAFDEDANVIERARFDLKKKGLDFTSKEFVEDKKQIALMEYRQEMDEINRTLANELLGKKDDALAKDKARNAEEAARLKLNTAILDIDQQAAQAIETQTKKQDAADKKAATDAKRIADAAKRTADERARQVDQAMTLEREFTLELANRQSVSQLETDRNNIHAEYEQRMERLRKIGDKTLTADAERLAAQIKTSKLAEAEANARERSLRAANSLKDSQAGFEMQLATLQANASGQFGGVFGGSQRTAFLGGLEMDFELQKRNREIGLMQGKVAAGTAQQSEVENLIAARDQYKLYQEQILEATVAQEQFAEALAVTRPVTDSLFDGLMAVAEGTKTAEQAFADFLRGIASMLVDVAKQMIAQYIAIGIARMFAGVPTESSGLNIEGVQQYVTEPFNAGDFTNAFSPRALGGSVAAGRPYMVGERGPELFVPGAQGNIVPNNAMGSASVTVNVDASGSSVEGNADQASQLGKVLGAAVQAELIKQKRPGGLLAS